MPKARRVVRYSLDGDYIAWYPSMESAARACGVTRSCVHQSIKRKVNCAESQWRYAAADGAYPQRIEQKKPGQRKERRVAKYTLTGRYLAWYPTLVSAAESVGATAPTLYQAIKRGGLCRGYLWKDLPDDGEPEELADFSISRRGRRALGGYLVFTPSANLSDAQRKNYLKGPYFIGLFRSLEQVSAVMGWPITRVRAAEREFADGGYLTDESSDGLPCTHWKISVMRLESEGEAENWLTEFGGERDGELYRVTEWPGREDE